MPHLSPIFHQHPPEMDQIWHPERWNADSWAPQAGVLSAGVFGVFAIRRSVR